MKKWVTSIDAISPVSGELTNYMGPYIKGDTLEDAENYREHNGLGYCHVIGMLVAEIPAKGDGVTPDWDKAVWYDADNATDTLVNSGGVFHKIRYIK